MRLRISLAMVYRATNSRHINKRVSKQTNAIFDGKRLNLRHKNEEAQGLLRLKSKGFAALEPEISTDFPNYGQQVSTLRGYNF